MSLKPDHSKVPGVVIDHSPASTKQYLGSPSIVIMPNGDYIASYDLFGPGTNYDRMAVFRSRDKGETWTQISELIGQWWSNLFLHKGDLYLLGTSREYGYAVIRRSTDAGKTWTVPKDKHTGQISTEDRYHCAPMPVVVHNGYLWRAYELAHGPREEWKAQVLSIPEDADLLQAENWRFSEAYQHLWSSSQWIEGNIVITPDNKLVNILRSNLRNVSPEEIQVGSDKAAILHISEDGKTLTHDRDKDLIDFPGGGVKFTIRFDDQTQCYWSLGCKQTDPPAYRNTLVLTSSTDLQTWRIESVILHHPDPKKHAFQYVDWQFEGTDIIVASRTAYDDGLGGAHNAHDANYLTFHRIENFRERTTDDLPLNEEE